MENELIERYGNYIRLRTPQSEKEFVLALAGAQVAAPVTYSMRDERLLEQKPAFRLIFSDTKRAYFPLFTDTEELKRFYKDEKALKAAQVSPLSYIRLFLSSGKSVDGIVINPCKDNIIITKEMLADFVGRDYVQPLFDEIYGSKNRTYTERKEK